MNKYITQDLESINQAERNPKSISKNSRDPALIDTSKSVTRSPRARTGEASWERREGSFYGPNRLHACLDIIWSNEPSYHHTSKTNSLTAN